MLTEKTAKIILFMLSSIITNIISEFSNEGYLTVTPQRADVIVGERVEINCSVHNITRPFMLRWDKYLKNTEDSNVSRFRLRINIQTPYVKTHSPSDNTRMLVINSARPQDEGRYRCVAVKNDGQALKKEMEVHVKSAEFHIKLDEFKLAKYWCNDFMFKCKGGIPQTIFCTDVCDGVKNCPDGSDEEGCFGGSCENNFRCNNSMCINKRFVCDHFNDCGDFSDEENCDFLMEAQTLSPEVADTADEDQLSWLKTTVYTVIACTVGVVLFISVVVITVFRIKMKRAAARRAARRAERRNQSSSHGNGNRGNRSQGNRNRGHEHEPFISAPSPTHFGNIIVNVNNGVQYVPNSEFNVLLQAPPTYSEVVAENCLEPSGRHSPPPAYTTIDRNPQRSSDADGLDDQAGTNVTNEETRSNTENIAVNDDLVTDAQNDAVLNNQSTESQAIAQENCGDTVESPISDGATSSSEAANVSPRSLKDRHPEHRLGKIACRPKQLQVRNGQIVLDSSSSGSSSPETVNRNTQTNPADYNVENQGARKSHKLQVQDGQIVLTNQVPEHAIVPEAAVAMETETVSTPGQLEVVEGQIVFKSS